MRVIARGTAAAGKDGMKRSAATTDLRSIAFHFNLFHESSEYFNNSLPRPPGQSQTSLGAVRGGAGAESTVRKRARAAIRLEPAGGQPARGKPRDPVLYGNSLEGDFQ